MAKKIVLATIYGLLVSLTGVGVYALLDSKEKIFKTNAVQFQQILPAYEDTRKIVPAVPIPSKYPYENASPQPKDMLQNDQSEPEKTSPKVITPEIPKDSKSETTLDTSKDDQSTLNNNRGNFDQQSGAYDEER